MVWTPSGGLHIYGRAGRLAELANSRLDLSGTLVEIKARKGYVVAPPSVVNNGAYRFVKPLDGLGLASIDEILADLRTLFSQQETLEVKESTTSRVVGSRRRRKPATAAKLENQREARGLEHYDREQGFVGAVIRLLMISTRVDWTLGTSSKFCCILHPETNPSASLFRTQNGVWVYSDHHQQEGRQIYLLVDLYARAKHGAPLPLTRNQRAKWKLRLLADTQRLSARPSDLDLPTLPAELSQDALKVFQGFALLQALTWADRPGMAWESVNLRAEVRSSMVRASGNEAVRQRQERTSRQRPPGSSRRVRARERASETTGQALQPTWVHPAWT